MDQNRSDNSRLRRHGLCWQRCASGVEMGRNDGDINEHMDPEGKKNSHTIFMRCFFSL